MLSMSERITKVETRLDGIEDRLDRAARAFYFAGGGLLTLAAAIVGSVVVH